MDERCDNCKSWDEEDHEVSNYGRCKAAVDLSNGHITEKKVREGNISMYTTDWESYKSALFTHKGHVCGDYEPLI